MELKAARCPSCQGDLDITEGKKIIECPYCGTDVIIIQDSKYIKTTSITDILKLAETEYKVGNYAIAKRHYDRILEIEPTNPDAWYGKGLIAASNLSKNSKMSIQMKEYFDKAIEYSSGEKKELLQNYIDNFLLSEVDRLIKSGWSILYSDTVNSLNFFLTDWLLNIQERKPKQENILELIIDSYLLFLMYFLSNKNKSVIYSFTSFKAFKADEATIKNNIDIYSQKLFELNPEKANNFKNKYLDLIKQFSDKTGSTDSIGTSIPQIKKTFKIIILLIVVILTALIVLYIYFKSDSKKISESITLRIDKNNFCSNEKYSAVYFNPLGGKLSGEGINLDHFHPQKVNIGTSPKKEIEIKYTLNDGTSKSVTVTVYNNPVLNFNTKINTVEDNICKVSFENKSIYTDSFVWDFGDGTTSTEIHPIHEYNMEKVGEEINVTLQAYNNICNGSKSIKIRFPKK